MKFSLVLMFILISQIDLLSQQWTFQEKQSSFDGKVKIAQVYGVGTDNVYRKPYMIINYFEKHNNLNIYFGDAGFSGCDNKLIYLIIDGNSSDIETHLVESNREDDIWFMGVNKDARFLGEEEKYLVLKNLLTKLKAGQN